MKYLHPDAIVEKGGRRRSESDGVVARGGGSHACLRRNRATTGSWKRLSGGWGGESGSPTLPSLRSGSPTSKQLALSRIRNAANGTDDAVDLNAADLIEQGGARVGGGGGTHHGVRVGGSGMVLYVRGRAGRMLASRWRELGPPVGRSGEAHVAEATCGRVERRATY
jgi:hypothetical protein